MRRRNSNKSEWRNVHDYTFEMNVFYRHVECFNIQLVLPTLYVWILLLLLPNFCLVFFSYDENGTNLRTLMVFESNLLLYEILYIFNWSSDVIKFFHGYYSAMETKVFPYFLFPPIVYSQYQKLSRAKYRNQPHLYISCEGLSRMLVTVLRLLLFNNFSLFSFTIQLTYNVISSNLLKVWNCGMGIAGYLGNSIDHK